MSDLPLILFPHTHITLPDVKKILAQFGSLTICQPWFMDPPLWHTERGDYPSLRILQPPASLKPKGDFRTLLSEYQLWIRQNQDRGYAAFLRTAQVIGHSEDTPWKIRQMIRQMGKHPSPPAEDRVLEWHLILHLAHEFEENWMEAEAMLKEVRQQKPPLQDALGEGAPSRGLFEDLPQPERYPASDERYLRQVFEAWVGLFGAHLKEHELLITLNHHVMTFATDIFEDKIVRPLEDEGDTNPLELTSSKNRITQKHFPMLSDKSASNLDPVLGTLSGKTIILLEEQG